MQRPPLIALEVVLGLFVPIGWAIWELYCLRRERERDQVKASTRAADAAPNGERTVSDLTAPSHPSRADGT